MAEVTRSRPFEHLASEGMVLTVCLRLKHALHRLGSNFKHEKTIIEKGESGRSGVHVGSDEEG